MQLVPVLSWIVTIDQQVTYVAPIPPLKVPELTQMVVLEMYKSKESFQE